MNINDFSASRKVKPLPKHIRVKLREFNLARRGSGMEELRVLVRTCLSCGSRFESVGSRMCGCVDRQVSSLNGHDLLH